MGGVGWNVLLLSAWLIVADVKGRITIEDAGQTFDVDPGTDVLLPCQFQTNISGLTTIEWNKKLCDGSYIRVNTITIIPPSIVIANPNITYGNRVSNLGSNLVLNSTEESDSAEYTCVVTIGFVSNSSKRYLRIKKTPAPPVITSDVYEAEVGETVFLKCTSKGARPFVDIAWQYPTSGSNVPGISIENFSAYNADCDPDYGDTVSMFAWTVTSGMEGRRCVTCTATGIAVQGTVPSDQFCFEVKGQRRRNFLTPEEMQLSLRRQTSANSKDSVGSQSKVPLYEALTSWHTAKEDIDTMQKPKKKKKKKKSDIGYKEPSIQKVAVPRKLPPLKT